MACTKQQSDSNLLHIYQVQEQADDLIYRMLACGSLVALIYVLSLLLCVRRLFIFVR